MDRYSFELSIENTMWNGLGYLPRHSGSSTCATLCHFRGSGSAELKTEQLFSRRLFIMTRNLPSGEKPISWPGELILSNVTVQVSLPAAATGYWPCESLLDCRNATGSKFFSASRMQMPPHRRTTVAAQRPCGCQIVPSAPVRVSGAVPGSEPSSTESSPIGTISQ